MESHPAGCNQLLQLQTKTAQLLSLSVKPRFSKIKIQNTLKNVIFVENILGNLLCRLTFRYFVCCAL